MLYYNRQSTAASILTVLGAIGTFVSVIFAAKGAVKAHQIITEEENKLGADLTFKEKAELTWKCWVPTGISVAATIGCNAASHKISKAQITALAGSLSAMGITYNKVKDKLKEKFGEEGAKEIRIAEGTIRDKSFSTEYCRPKMFYDSTNDIWFTSTLKSICETEMEVEKKLIIRGYTSCADFYDILNQVQIKGCPAVDYPDRLRKTGWTYDGLIDEYDFPWIEFEHIDRNQITKEGETIDFHVNDGKPYTEISTPLGLTKTYLEYLQRYPYVSYDDGKISWMADDYPHPNTREKNEAYSEESC